MGNGIPKLVERIAPPAQRSPAALARGLAVFEAEYAAHMLDSTAPYPGLPALLAELKTAGVRMAVLSNKDDAFAKSIVARYFGENAFAAVRGAQPGTPPKPDPAALLALLGQMGADPAATLVVGDSDVDVFTAHNAGLPCCGVLWGFRGEAELTAAGADALAADPAQLGRIILQEAQPHGKTV